MTNVGKKQTLATQVKPSQVNFIPLPSGSIGNKTKYTYMKLQMKNVSDAQPNEYTV
jgi:hypothetical protein